MPNVEWFDVPFDEQEGYWIAKSMCKISLKNLASGEGEKIGGGAIWRGCPGRVYRGHVCVYDKESL